jgi:hypothetical protein
LGLLRVAQIRGMPIPLFQFLTKQTTVPGFPLGAPAPLDAGTVGPFEAGTMGALSNAD